MIRRQQRSPFAELAFIGETLKRAGAKPVHERKIFRAWLGRDPWDGLAGKSLPARVTALVPELRASLASLAEPVLDSRASDGSSAKLLMRLSDGENVETVVLPKDGVCVSTQAGCAVGCRFCMTGRFGLVRQLGSAEIVAQVAAARAVNPNVRKVDFMGMGEPSHNLRAVMEAVQFLGTYGDFGHKALMISSVGDPRLFDALDALEADAVRPALAVSLHSASDEKRRELLPRAPKMTVDEIVRRAQIYGEKVRYPVQYEWVLIKGLNDGEDELSRLVSLLRGRQAMVNFIPVNPNPGSGYVRPGKEHCVKMLERLRSEGIVAKIRLSAAQDVSGGCGQLRARVLGCPEK